MRFFSWPIGLLSSGRGTASEPKTVYKIQIIYVLELRTTVCIQKRGAFGIAAQAYHSRNIN
jgi:hypothetical protein